MFNFRQLLHMLFKSLHKHTLFTQKGSVRHNEVTPKTTAKIIIHYKNSFVVLIKQLLIPLQVSEQNCAIWSYFSGPPSLGPGGKNNRSKNWDGGYLCYPFLCHRKFCPLCKVSPQTIFPRKKCPLCNKPASQVIHSSRSIPSFPR